MFVGAQLGAWSSRWNWVARPDAYDRYIDERNRSRLEARRDDILERVGQGGQLLSYAALRALAGDTNAEIPPLDPRNLDPDDLIRFLETGAKLELQSLGQVTDLKGAFLITPAEVTRIVKAMVDAALPYVEPLRQEAYLHDAAAAVGVQLT